MSIIKAGTYKVEIEFTLEEDTLETTLDSIFEEAIYNQFTDISSSDIGKYVRLDTEENKMNFEQLLEELRKGKTFEEIAEEFYEQQYNCCCNVECIANIVYEDEDLNEFLDELGARIEGYGDNYVLVKTENDYYYEIPYEENTNRHDSDLPNETIIFFDINRIYDVTKDNSNKYLDIN